MKGLSMSQAGQSRTARDYTPPLGTGRNLKLMNRSFPELSTYYFCTAIDRGVTEPAESEAVI